MPPRPLSRPLAIVLLLALGDYLLWNWSLSGSHDVLALVAGLTLPPLLIALVWLLVVGAARLLAGTAQRSRTRRAHTGVRSGAANGNARPHIDAQPAHGPRAVTRAGEASSTSPSSKLAA